jgi:hypothetical protein
MQKIITNTENKLYLILLIHFMLVFILGASSTTLPNDMIENLIWGRNLDFSSDKHPPFFGWESYLWVKLFGGNLLAYHLLSPLHQVVMLFFVYLLANKIFSSKDKALLAVILTQGIFIFILQPKFNANTANYGFFSAIYYYFYVALKERKYHFLVVVGMLSAIIMLIKYSGILLIASLGLIFLITPEGRSSFKSPFLYIGILIFGLILSPYILHTLNNQSSLNYLAAQSEGRSLAMTVIKIFFTAITLCLPLLIAFFRIKKSFTPQPKNFDTVFLLISNILPFVLTVAYVLVGYLFIKKSSVGFFWLIMFYSLFGICLIYFWDVKKDALKIAFKTIYPLILFLYTGPLIANIVRLEYDTKSIHEFIKKVNTENIQDFICNDGRSKCGHIILYGNGIDFGKMEISLFENPFKTINNKTEKPSKVIIIGEDFPINLPDYTITTYKADIPGIFKFWLAEKIYHFANSIVDLKQRESFKTTLTIATLNTQNDTTTPH